MAGMLAKAAADAKTSASKCAEDVLKEINLARTAPKAYAEHLKPMLPKFEGNLFKTGTKINLMTNEGPAAVKEAIEFLEKATPLPALTAVSPGMNLAAYDHAADLGKSGITGHTGSDGSSPFDRMNRHGKWLGAAAENIAFGDGTPRDRIIQLIIDDGVASRGHRKNIFNGDFLLLGAAEGKHSQFNSCMVNVFAKGFTEGGGTGAKAAAPATTTPAAAAASSSTPVDKPMEKLAVTPTPAAKPTPAVTPDKPTPEAAAKLADMPKEKLNPPPGGRVDVKKSMVTSTVGNKKTTTTTTTITTMADGSSTTSIVTETLEEIIG